MNVNNRPAKIARARESGALRRRNVRCVATSRHERAGGARPPLSHREGERPREPQPSRPRLPHQTREILPVKISPLGDSALLIDFADESSNPEILLRRALSAAEALKHAKIPGVIEITSAYQSVALFLDAPMPSDASLTARISRVLTGSKAVLRFHQRQIEVPVCYDAEFALDASRVADKTLLSFEKIIELHSSAKFTVACIGFMPGFPYLAGLPGALHLPRLASPRTKVPAGSVAIASAQTGIYPLESPGGWNIIGRTPLRLFEPRNTFPALLATGDKVRFRPITRDEFKAASSNEK
jgi:KipI family sensor histidine kinase inhibitor